MKLSSPTQWSVRTHVLTWIPAAAFVLAMINSERLWALQPFVTKVGLEALSAQVEVLLIYRLSDEIARLEAKERSLRIATQASDDPVLVRDLNETTRKLGSLRAQLAELCKTPALQLAC